MDLQHPLELHRSFPDLDLDVNAKEGRVTGLVVPYLRPTPIMELRDGAVIQYEEQFAPGSMERAARAPNRLMFQFTHSEMLDHQVGYGVSFRDSEELSGCVGEFQLYRANRDKVMEMLETSHRGLSVTFASLRPQGGLERDGELVTREVVHCRAVAAVNDPAYADAGVLAVRQSAELAAEVAAEAERKRDEMKELLQFLVDQGQPLTEAHRAWLVDNQVELMNRDGSALTL
jgi:phage head maturation protease